MARIIDFGSREIIHDEPKHYSSFPWKNNKFRFNFNGTPTNIYILAKNTPDAIVIMHRIQRQLAAIGVPPLRLLEFKSYG